MSKGVISAVLVAVALCVAPGSAAAADGYHACGFVSFTPNSGDGAFEIRAKGVSCARVRRLLREARDENREIAGYRCRDIRHYPQGNARVRCVNRSRPSAVFLWTTGL